MCKIPLIFLITSLFASASFGFSIINLSTKGQPYSVEQFFDIYLCKTPADCTDPSKRVTFATNVLLYSPVDYGGNQKALPLAIYEYNWNKNTNSYQSFPYVYLDFTNGPKTIYSNQNCEIIMKDAGWKLTKDCTVR